MSGIQVSQVVDVTISTTPVFPSRRGFGILNIVGISEVISLGERFRLYASIDDVVADFAVTDEEYLAAQVFFSQNPRPDQLIISRRADVDYPAELRCGLSADQTIATWAALTDGEFTMTMGLVTENVVGMDFNAAAVSTMAEIAAVIETELQVSGVSPEFATATCTWDGTRFIIKSGVAGAGTITVLSEVPAGVGTSIVALMDGGVGDGIAVGGVDQETITESLAAIELADDSWYGLAFTKELNDENADILLAADWCEARVKLFANSSTDLAVKDSLSTTDVAYVLEAGGYHRTFTLASFSDEDYIAISMFARFAVVNFSGVDTTITGKFKTLPSITTDDLNTNDASVISGKSANYYAFFGANNMVAEAVCADGSFIDSVHGVDWLTNALETGVFGALYTAGTKIPLTDKGAARLTAKAREVLDEAVTNGLLAPGTTLAGAYLAKGYIVTVKKVADLSEAEKAAREGPLIQFVAIGAGAIHSIGIDGVFEG